MGSEVDVRGVGGDDPEVLVDEVLGRLERSWSRFDPGSDLSRLNSDPRPEREVPLLLAAAVARAVTAWRCTDGAFDPTVHDALVAAGYDRTFEEVEDRTVPAHPGCAVPGCDRVEVRVDEGVSPLDPDAADAVVRRPPGLNLDLGGIGKGLAVDLVADVLVAAGVESAIVSLGGDVRLAGRVPNGGFAVPVVDPWDGTELTALVLQEPGAVVTSSTRRRRWQTDDGGWAHHLIDPRTGRPAERGVAAVVAVAAEAWWAESLAKAALVLGATEGAALLDRHGATALVLRNDTSVLHVGTERHDRPGAPVRSRAATGPGRPDQPGGSLSSAASSAREPMPSFP